MKSSTTARKHSNLILRNGPTHCRTEAEIPFAEAVEITIIESLEMFVYECLTHIRTHCLQFLKCGFHEISSPQVKTLIQKAYKR